MRTASLTSLSDSGHLLDMPTLHGLDRGGDVVEAVGVVATHSAMRSCWTLTRTRCLSPE